MFHLVNLQVFFVIGCSTPAIFNDFRRDFEAQIDLIEKMVAKFTMTPPVTEVGVVVYSGKGASMPIDLGALMIRKDLLSRLASLDAQDFSTGSNVAEGMKMAADTFRQKRKEGVPQRMLVIIDKKPTSQVDSVVSELNRAKVDIVGVGIGDNLEEDDITRISRDDFVLLDDTTELKNAFVDLVDDITGMYTSPFYISCIVDLAIRVYTNYHCSYVVL